MIIVIIIISLILILFLVMVSVFFKDTIMRKPKEDEVVFSNKLPKHVLDNLENGRKWLREQQFTYDYITSFDGLKLAVDIIEQPAKTGKIMLMMHGYRAQDYLDFAVSAKLFYDMGYTLVLPHQRAHDKSEGKYVCFGIKERYDCRDWINYIVNRYGKSSKIVLSGVSMGCATVLMTLGFSDLPKNVKACIADCGFTSPINIFKYVFKRDNKHLPASPILGLGNLMCKLFAGFSFTGYSVPKALENNKIPVLFIHGDSDTYVPSYMSKQNFEACTAEKELLIIKEARHAQSFAQDKEKCISIATKFLRKYV